MTSELVFTSRELVKKKAARVDDWLATFTLFPLSPVQKAGNNATDRVSCTNYFMSIEIIRCSVRRIKTTKPDKKTICGKITLYLFNMTQQCAVAGLPREANNGCFDAANANKSCVRVHGVNPPSFPSIPPHENAAIVRAKITRDIFGSDYIGPSVDAAITIIVHTRGGPCQHGLIIAMCGCRV